MAESAIDYLNLTRICEITRALQQHHQIGGDEGIDREFNAVCRTIWGYSLNDFTDDNLSPNDHAAADGRDRDRARRALRLQRLAVLRYLGAMDDPFSPPRPAFAFAPPTWKRLIFESSDSSVRR
jgi:hypothetical protein